MKAYLESACITQSNEAVDTCYTTHSVASRIYIQGAKAHQNASKSISTHYHLASVGNSHVQTAPPDVPPSSPALERFCS